jgi:hypothetical protein
MVSIQAVCHPEEAALIWAAIEQATKELYAARHAAAREGRVADVSAGTCSDNNSAETCGKNNSAGAYGEHNPHDVSEPCGTNNSAGTCGEYNATRPSAGVSAETCDDPPFDEDDADSYEEDCAFYERFGVCPEPEDRPRAQPDHVSEPVTQGWVRPAYPDDACATAPSAESPRPRFNRIDGLLALIRKVACGESLKTPVEIVVTVSADALKAGGASDECVAIVDGDACVSAETARRLSCDAGIVQMVEDANGNPLSVGRRTRSIPTSIRRALFQRDKCCRFPGCTNRVYVEGHHIEHWANGGQTALHNLVSLCGRHHKFVHEYGYRIEVDGDGEPHFFDPRGRPAKDVPSRIVRDDLGWPHILEANRDLGIEAHACGWTGEPINYDDVCHALYRVDEGLLLPDDIC